MSLVTSTSSCKVTLHIVLNAYQDFINMEHVEMLSKREKRKQSKKQKAAAFLELAKVDIRQTMKRKTDECITGPATEDACVKKQKNDKLKEEQDIDLKQVLKNSTKTMEEDLEKLRKAIREKQKQSMEKPKLYLTLDELASQHGRLISQDLNKKELPPLFMLDLQHLLLFALQGNLSSYKPRWCKLLRCGKVSGIVVLEMDSVGSYEYQKYPECFTKIKENFEMCVDMICPTQYGSTIAEDLFYVPVSMNHMRKLNVPKFKREKYKELTKIPEFVAVDQSDCPVTLHNDDVFPRSCLLLNTAQMLQEGYPMPLCLLNDTYKDFIFLSDEYKTVTSQSPLFAVDCEMCLTVAGKQELTRISIVNEKLETVYDTLVKPFNKIKDYLTRWSGITKFILDPVTTRLEDVHRDLQRILPNDAILCGQSLNSDLIALHVFHPYVVDTSIIYNLSGHRTVKTSLKKLASHFLGHDIQESETGHCSVEDAKATMELVLLKLRNSVDFGDVVMGGVLFPKITDSDITKTGDMSKSQSDVVSVHSDSSEHKQEHSQHCDPQNKTKQSTQCDTVDNKLLTSRYITKTTNTEIQRRRAFFQREGEFVYQNFFKLVRESCKTAALVASKDITDCFSKEDIVTMETNSDKTSKSLARSYTEFHDFVYASFPSYSQHICSATTTDEEVTKKCLRKLDAKIDKVLQNIKAGTLVAVVMSGGVVPMGNSAKTFVKIV